MEMLQPIIDNLLKITPCIPDAWSQNNKNCIIYCNTPYLPIVRLKYKTHYTIFQHLVKTCVTGKLHIHYVYILTSTYHSNQFSIHYRPYIKKPQFITVTQLFTNYVLKTSIYSYNKILYLQGPR